MQTFLFTRPPFRAASLQVHNLVPQSDLPEQRATLETAVSMIGDHGAVLKGP